MNIKRMTEGKRFSIRAKHRIAMFSPLVLGIALSVPAHASLWDNFNTGAVVNVTVGPGGTFSPTKVTLSSAATVSQIATYHFNNGRGAAPGTITITALQDNLFSNNISFSGTFPAQLYDSFTWLANVNVVLPAGDYVVFDSSPSTWSVNSQSGTGFVNVFGNYLSPTTVYDNFNTQAVVNDPTRSTTFVLTEPTQISQIQTYHWNNGSGEAPSSSSTIKLTGFGAPIQFNVLGEPGGNGNVRNATWDAVLPSPKPVLPAGTYTITDSSPSTWSQNQASNGEGFTMVLGNILSSQVRALPFPTQSSASGGSGGSGAGGGGAPTMSCGGIPAYYVVMAPCTAASGGIMTLTVVNTLPRKIATVTFYCVGAPFGPANFCSNPNSPTSSLLDVSIPMGAIAVTGNGTAPGSVYSFIIPASLGVGGSDSEWEAIAYDGNGNPLGSVGIFTYL